MSAQKRPAAVPTGPPWCVELDLANDGDINILGPELQPIALVDVREDGEDDLNPPREVALANAYLMAAAPELLASARADEAGEQHVKGCDRCKRGGDCEDGIRLLHHASELRRAAIAKAERRS